MELSPAIWVPSAVILIGALLTWISSHRSSVWKEGESLRVAYREEALLTRTEMTKLRETLDKTSKTLDTTRETLDATREELAASRLDNAETRAINARLLDELRIARGEK
jgi:hypothetical protein